MHAPGIPPSINPSLPNTNYPSGIPPSINSILPSNNSPLPEPEIRRSLEEMLKEKLCNYCGLKDPSLILPDCFHFYHIECLKKNKFLCGICNYFSNIEGISKENLDSCKICSEKSYLISCRNCKEKYCFFCVTNRNLGDCCNSTKEYVAGEVTTCSGCLTKTPFSEIIPIKCDNHGLICKKCWNISAGNKECIFGCKRMYDFAFYCKCETCDDFSIKFIGSHSCPENCEVCDSCQTQYTISELKKRSPLHCVNCGSNLTKKFA